MLARMRPTTLCLLVALLIAGCRKSGPAQEAEPKELSAVPVTPAVAAAVAAPDRSPEDRALDAGRHAAETLSFFGISPGQRVAEIAAGGGYTSELMARVVGDKGQVYAVNSPFVLERFAQKPWTARLEKPQMKVVVRLDRPFDDPLPADVKGLDAVLDVLFYHDTFWQDVDRGRMNHAIFEALRPGGVYGIVDHSGRPGSGSAETKSLHRIEERLVREEIEKAGFRFDGAASFLRNTSDTRDWNDAPSAAAEKRGTSDRFVLRFVKP
jgi:predicted methyltransferase